MADDAQSQTHKLLPLAAASSIAYRSGNVSSAPKRVVQTSTHAAQAAVLDADGRQTQRQPLASTTTHESTAQVRMPAQSRPCAYQH